MFGVRVMGGGKRYRRCVFFEKWLIDGNTMKREI